jgi:hypothetical protein
MLFFAHAPRLPPTGEGSPTLFLSGRICTSEAMHTPKKFAGIYAKQGYYFSILKKIIEIFIKEHGSFLRIQRMIRANGSIFNSGRKGMGEMSCGKYGQRCTHTRPW